MFLAASSAAPEAHALVRSLAGVRVDAGGCGAYLARSGTVALSPFVPTVSIDGGTLTVERGEAAGPAYFAFCEAGVVVSDSMDLLVKALRDSGAPSPRVDAEAMATLVGFGTLLPEQTSYVGVSRLAQGGRATFRHGKFESLGSAASGAAPERSASGHPDDQRPSVERAAALAFEWVCAALERAVGGRRRVALLLSGGLDSSGVLAAALACGYRDRLIPVFLEAGPRSTDAAYVLELERAFDLETHRISVDDVVKGFRGGIVLDAMPYATSTAPADLAVVRALAALRPDVVVTGVGGDELWSGVGERRLRDLPAAFAARSPLASHLRQCARPLLRPFMPASRRRARISASLPRYLQTSGIGRAREVLTQRNLRNGSRAHWGSEVAARLAHSEGWRMIADWRGPWASAIGAPRADLYCEPELVRRVSSLPTPYLSLNGRSRGLYRESLRGKLPPNVVDRTDKGEFEWLCQETVRRNQDLMRPLLSMQALSRLGVDCAHDGALTKDFHDVVEGRSTSMALERVFLGLGAEWFARWVDA